MMGSDDVGDQVTLSRICRTCGKPRQRGSEFMAETAPFLGQGFRIVWVFRFSIERFSIAGLKLANPKSFLKLIMRFAHIMPKRAV